MSTTMPGGKADIDEISAAAFAPRPPAALPSAGLIRPKMEDAPNGYIDLGEQPPVNVEEAEASDTETENTPADATETETEEDTSTVEVTPEWILNLPQWVQAFRPTKDTFWLGRLKWWAYAKFGLFEREWIKPPETLSRADMWAEIRANEQYVTEHRYTTYTTSVTSSGGGATKSTVIGTLAAYSSEFNGQGAALLALDLGADKTKFRFNQTEDDLLSTTELSAQVSSDVIFSPRDLIHKTASDAESKLILFKAKPEVEKATRDIPRRVTAKLVRYMVRLYPKLFCDGGPGTNLQNSVGMLLASDIVILPKRGLTDESIGDIRSVIEYPFYKLANKRDRLIVVISDVPHDQLNTREQYDIAERVGVDPKQVILIPYDPYLDDHIKGNKKFVSIRALALKTRLMYSRLMKLNVQIAETFQSRIHTTF